MQTTIHIVAPTGGWMISLNVTFWRLPSEGPGGRAVAVACLWTTYTWWELVISYATVQWKV